MAEISLLAISKYMIQGKGYFNTKQGPKSKVQKDKSTKGFLAEAWIWN